MTTEYRYLGRVEVRLDEQDFVEKTDGRFHLTGRGQAVADEVMRFEANVQTADRLAPLLNVVCEDHQEFVVELFVDARVMVAAAHDPYEPVEWSISLVDQTDNFMGFNTTPMAPLVLRRFHQQVFEGTETEIIYPPSSVEKLVETYPEQATEAIKLGHLALRTRDDLPYGLAIFVDRVGIEEYNESRGHMQVFHDTDSAIAREWVERVYASVRAESEPLSDVNQPAD